jgi:hypothetical protein
MNDIAELSEIEGQPATESQIRGILAQIDVDITNLVREGKLSALKYGIPGNAGLQTDRAANLRALLEARQHYESLLRSLPAWEVTQAGCVC